MRIEPNFFRGAVNHCYQRTADHGVLFYSVSDRLLFFTLFCVMAKRHGVHVYKLVLMVDHIHHSTVADSPEQLTAFVRDYSAIFAREYNSSFGRSGHVFENSFHYAPKRGDKVIRTNLLYLDNNPVERKLVKSAEDYQWNFLAYGKSDHPFSEKIVLRNASMALRKALKRVDWLHDNGQYIPYAVLKRMFESLPDNRERNQLVDYIIVKYSVIDHEAAMRFFGGYEQEVLAARSNTGSEYDICEGFVGKSDTCYSLFISLLLKDGLEDIHKILTASDNQKLEWFKFLKSRTAAPEKQIAAFLHLSVGVKY